MSVFNFLFALLFLGLYLITVKDFSAGCSEPESGMSSKFRIKCSLLMQIIVTSVFVICERTHRAHLAGRDFCCTEEQALDYHTSR